MAQPKLRYDYIIVGAGSAGCVLAHRLSQRPDTRVLLLEAGDRDRSPFIHMPAGLARLATHQGINWGYHTQAEPQLVHRRLYWPRGKVLGGSSAINAMCYIRGQRQDYDDWAQQAPTWAFNDVLPYFKRAEDYQDGPEQLFGHGGPLSVQRLRHHNVLSAAFIDAASQTGFACNDDFNGDDQAGFGFYRVTQNNGRRCSAASAYLRPARRRRNLNIITRALTERILISGGRAYGVTFRRGGQTQQATADGAVIISAGSINSPQLLMLSGIGKPEDIERHGLPVNHSLPGVGRHLQDHLDICTLYQCTQKNVTYDHPNELLVGLNYLLLRRGIGTSNIAEAGGFVCSSQATDGRPDLQFHFVPALLDDHGRNRLPGAGFTLHCCVLNPASRGHIELASADARVPPSICANYLSHPDDVKRMIEGVHLSRQILQAPALEPYRGSEIFPGAKANSDDEIDAFIRAKSETIYHPVGTCRMGQGEQTVVDERLCVHGVEGLRVVDASIMPTIVRGNTNGPTIMIAEKAADMILHDSV